MVYYSQVQKVQDPERLSDPKIFGQGTWYVMHILGMNAKTDEEKRNYERDMTVIINNLRCNTCKGHGQEYLKQNPISDFYNIKNADGEDVGMFMWSWLFHNDVNKRIGKPWMDWDTAYNMFSGKKPSLCLSGCGEESKLVPSRSFQYVSRK